jgi:hypothetical protein
MAGNPPAQPDQPHEASLAVWGHPSPVVVGEPFRLNAGAKCPAGCVLAGQAIEVHDECGTVVARGVLGEAQWTGTALYWTAVEVTAPAAEGHHCWGVRFPGTASGPPHPGASSAFGFVTVRPPEHRVSVRVVEKGTGTGLADAHVRLGVHRSSTDETGVTVFDVSSGEHRLFVSKPGYDTPASTVSITGSTYLVVEAVVIPPDNPDAYWRG